LRTRLAVIGVGDVAQRHYLPEFARLSEKAELVVACGLSEGQARAVADRYGIGRWTTSYGEAVAAADVDAVLNLTPFSVHGEVTLAALAAGKHVYSEKPVAGDSAELSRIHAEAERRALVVVAAPSVMLFPQVRRAQEILASGRLGAVHSIRAYAFGGVPPWEGYGSDPTPYFVAGGGPLVDMAVYPLHVLTGLLGPVERVAAFSGRTREAFEVVEGPVAGRRVPVEVDDNWHLLLELEGGRLASVQANNCVSVAGGPELELQGEVGTLGVSLLDVSEPLRTFTPHGVEEEVAPHVLRAGPDHLLGVEHLVACIRDGRGPVLDLGHAGHVIDVLEAAQRSVTRGQVADVRPTIPWKPNPVAGDGR
jgi:predicted dehydrogenase